ncbi:MAG: hypothetical protein M1833_000460 [Piccolia ochrophora]|nr:MAG: hypothetical protein M1833_000460 [Piccolia ochrophora]
MLDKLKIYERSRERVYTSADTTDFQEEAGPAPPRTATKYYVDPSAPLNTARQEEIWYQRKSLMTQENASKATKPFDEDNCTQMTRGWEST